MTLDLRTIKSILFDVPYETSNKITEDSNKNKHYLNKNNPRIAQNKGEYTCPLCEGEG